MASPHARVGSINVLLTTQVGPAVRGLNTFAQHVDRTGVTVAKSVQGIDRSLAGLNRSLGGMNVRGMTSLTLSALRARTAIDQLRNMALVAGVAVGGLMPAAVAANMIRTVDGAHRLSNQLRTVTKDADDLRATQTALFDVAQRTRSSFDGAVTIYARTARATQTLGLSQEKLLRITETVQKAFAVGGATAAEAQGAAIQLSQGIASNRFSGEEFRSVAENAPVLLMGMADALGVNIGKLREMAHAGLLTADTVTKAILASSDAIDESFAKTTSTVEQAWTRVGNAITKYAMDSENASAGQQALVHVLNGLAENISGFVDIVVALGLALATTFAARRLQAVSGWATSIRATRQETLAAAIATQHYAQSLMAATRADFLQKRLAFNKALREGTLSAKQLERQQKHLAAASAAYRGATLASADATQKLAIAQRGASASGMVMAGALRAGSVALSMLGGPVGAALLAVTGTMTAFGMRSSYAADRLRILKDELKALGVTAKTSSDDLDEIVKKLDEMSGDERRQRLRRITEEVERVMGGSSFWSNFWASDEDWKNFEFLTDQIRGSIELAKMLKLTPVDTEALRQMDQMIQKFREGDATTEELLKELEKISDVELSRPVDALIGRLREALGWVGALNEGLTKTADSMGAAAKSDRLVPPLSDTEFASRFGWKEYFKFTEEKDKKSSSRKSADDRFDNSVQAIYDRIEALRMERETVAATFFEQTRRTEALRLEQEALKQAREEARRKGDADWQNAQISEEKRRKIAEVSEALATEADMTRLAREEMELTRDIFKDVFSGLRSALEDGKLSWEELGDIALRVLDKIINKIEDEVISALMSMMNFGGGGFLGGIGGGSKGYFPPAPTPAVAGMWHQGGDASSPRRFRSVPAIPALPRYHSGKPGIGHNEVMAILEKSESVFTGQQTGRIGNALSASVGGLSERSFNLNIDVKGAKAEYSETKDGANLRLFPQMMGAVAEDIAKGGVIGRQIQNTFGVKRNAV